MPVSTRKAMQIQDRRSQVAELYLTGKTQKQIAEQFGVNFAQISRDLKVIRQEWLESRVRDFDEAKAEELAKNDVLEVEYWDAWRRSIGTHTSIEERLT
jgi:Trp operon repressor